MEVIRTIQPTEFFNMLDVKDFNEANKVLKNTLDFLVYMKVGDQLSTSSANFNKINTDLIQLDVNVDYKVFMDSLVKRKVIKFPG